MRKECPPEGSDRRCWIRSLALMAQLSAEDRAMGARSINKSAANIVQVEP
jgi:hypothetical protein